MELEMIEADRALARERYREYSAAVKRRHNAEDEAIAAGYKALAAGKRLISLQATMRTGGVDEHGRPRLAIAPASIPFVWMRRDREGGAVFSTVQQPRSERSKGCVRLPADTFGRLPYRHDETNETWRLLRFNHRAMVPIVPPEHRPTAVMTTYHILFEAEWEEMPPVDPALLKHLRGDLWIVCAEWNLTDLERAVLTERF